MPQHETVDGRPVAEWLQERHTNDAVDVHAQTISERSQMRLRAVPKQKDPLFRPTTPSPVRCFTQEEIDQLNLKRKEEKMSRWKLIDPTPIHGGTEIRENRFISIFSRLTTPTRFADFRRIYIAETGDSIPYTTAQKMAIRLAKRGAIVVKDGVGESNPEKIESFGLVLIPPASLMKPEVEVAPVQELSPQETPATETSTERVPAEDMIRQAIALLSQALGGMKATIELQNLKITIEPK